MDSLPRLSRTFWAYLQGLDQYVDRLLELLEAERLSLLGREFTMILKYAREKEELIKKIAHGEERLSAIIRHILSQVNADQGAEGTDTLRAFKKILDFKDFIRFETWHTNYMGKREEVRARNLRNIRWAEDGLNASMELSRVLMGYRTGEDSGEKAVLYDQRGVVRDGRQSWLG